MDISICETTAVISTSISTIFLRFYFLSVESVEDGVEQIKTQGID